MTKEEKQYLANVAEWAAQHYGSDIMEYLNDADFMASIMKEYNQRHRDFISKHWVNSGFMSAVSEVTYVKINS